MNRLTKLSKVIFLVVSAEDQLVNQSGYEGVFGQSGSGL